MSFFFNTRDRGGKKKEIRFIEEVMTKTQKRWSQLRLSTRDKWRGELNSCGGREKKRFEGKESQLSFFLLLLLLLKKNFLQKTKNVLRNPKGGRTGDDCVIIVIQDRVGMRFCFVFVCFFCLFFFSWPLGSRSCLLDFEFFYSLCLSWREWESPKWPAESHLSTFFVENERFWFLLLTVFLPSSVNRTDSFQITKAHLRRSVSFFFVSNKKGFNAVKGNVANGAVKTIDSHFATRLFFFKYFTGFFSSCYLISCLVLPGLT